MDHAMLEHMRTPRQRRTMTATTVLLTVGLLAGCATNPASPQFSSGLAPSTTPVPIATDDFTSSGLPLGLVPGLEISSRSNEERHIYAQWLTHPPVPEIAQAQQQLINDQEEAFLADTAPADGDTIAPAELNIRPQLTAVSSQMIGIRLGTYAFYGANGAMAYTTTWFDGRGAAQTTRDLFAGENEWNSFIDAVAGAMEQRAGVTPEAIGELSAALLDSVNFDAAGNALVEFDEYSIASGSEGTIVVKVDSELLLPLLNENGLAARSAGMNPTGRDMATATPGGSAPGVPAPSSALPDENANAAADCRKVKCVALTFDDGPGPKTPKLLDTLKAADAKGTFFVVGPNASARPETLRRTLAEGHEIGNHTWNHRMLTSLSATQVQKEVDSVNDKVVEISGLSPTLMRPPYGATNSSVQRLSTTPVVLWDVDTLDWKLRDSKKVAANVLRDTKPGSIVLMHDIHGTTINAVPQILRGLKAKGYHFVTVSQLLASEPTKSGTVYSRGPAPSGK